MSGDVDDATNQQGVATASYVSTTAILERESRLLARRQLSLPGFWRGFARRRVLVAVLVVAAISALTLLDGVEAEGAVRGIVLMLVALCGLTALDVWLTRHRIHRAHRVVAAARCPPGTVVQARYTPEEFTFGLPGHRLVLEASSVTGGVHEGGLLYLEQVDGSGWVVPDELLGSGGLEVVRTALGKRLVER